MPATFYVGDTLKDLRAVIQDEDGVRVNLTDGECRLFAVSREQRDRPTSNVGESEWGGIVGVFVNALDGEVDFEGIGGLLDIGVANSEIYDCQIKFTNINGRIGWSDPFTFTAVAPIDEAGS